MAKVLVTGMSGTGKSSALGELDRRGYRVVDTDDPGWSDWVASTKEVGGGEWLWLEDRMTELLRLDDRRTVFVQGCVRNQVKFYDRVDAVGPRLRAGCTHELDASRPLDEVVADLIAISEGRSSATPLIRRSAGCGVTWWLRRG
jgi:predicted ATPase